MSLLQKRALTLPERIALIALAGITVSVGAWFLHAWVDGVLFNELGYSHALIEPDAASAWSRFAIVLALLMGTGLLQFLYTRRAQAEHLLELERVRARLAYDNSPDSVLCMTPQLVVSYMNDKAAGLAGITVEEAVGMRCHEALLGSPEPCERCGMTDVEARTEAHEHTFLATRRSGRSHWLTCVQYPVLDAAGEIESIVETVRDVSALMLADEEIARALHDSRERHRLLVNHSPDMILVADDGFVSFVNPAGLELLGLDEAGAMLGRPVSELFTTDSSGATELARATGSGVFSRPIPVKLCRPDGYRIDVELTGTRMMIEGRQVVQYVARDITERLDAEQTIRTMAYFDPLTELPNRTLFYDRLRNAIAHARRSNSPLAVAFLDLDDFKLINDTLSHSIGDELLCLVGQRIRETVREEDTVARMSGDEFTIVAHLVTDSDAEVFAERLRTAFSEPFRVREHVLHVTASIGLALYPEHGTDPGELIKNADAAMYASKDINCNSFRIYEHAMGTVTLDRLNLESEMREALDTGAFHLYYQPQVDTRTGTVVGVEALVRWQHPTRGLLCPGSFLHVAEQSDLMTRIGHWVLETACSRAARWHKHGLEFGRIAVNLSAREFQQFNVVERVSDTLERTGLPPGLLEIEITENTVLSGVERVLDTLHALQALGTGIAIDDFGTGYSSLAYLKRFPIQTLKIAQTFMDDIHRDAHSAGIALMIVDLCRLLGLTAVAEGVEHQEQLDFLTSNGCHIVQGYVFSPPLAGRDIDALLTSGGKLQTVVA